MGRRRRDTLKSPDFFEFSLDNGNGGNHSRGIIVFRRRLHNTTTAQKKWIRIFFCQPPEEMIHSQNIFFSLKVEQT